MTSLRPSLADRLALRLGDFFSTPTGQSEAVISSGLFSRTRVRLPGGVSLIRDEFPDAGGACCLFIRLPSDVDDLRIVVEGAFRLVACAAGGWLLDARDASSDSYWIPQLPFGRSVDAHERILDEVAATVTALSVGADEAAATFRAPPGLAVEGVVWRIPAAARGLCSELMDVCNLERMRTLFWQSLGTYGLPAELYLYLIQGRVYQNARAYPRKWKFCCELDAYGLFVWMTGLESATQKRLYGLLRRQVLLSVIARQSPDGGWYHGEWTDLNECHYRFHNGALLLLSNALEEWNDEVVRTALSRGVAFVAARTDDTDLGLWFLHDSLEESAESMNEMYRQTGAIVSHFGAWKPSNILGKSATNKLILNTHVDTTVALDRYRRLCGDESLRERIDSARQATRRLLALRPAELLYRLVFWLVGLTLLPDQRARQLPLPARALKRLARVYVVPNLHRLKRRFPRIVMPGGFIDRHLAPLSFSVKYHAINVMDLARLWRRFPEERLEKVLDDAVHFVMADDKAILKWWGEAKARRMAIVAFADALYRLCMLAPARDYRKQLADVLLHAESLSVGLPPCILGGDAEFTAPRLRVPCPSPADGRLRVANLSRGGRLELLVVNPTDVPVALVWEASLATALDWVGADGRPMAGKPGAPQVPPRSWILGQQGDEGCGRQERRRLRDNENSGAPNHDHLALP